MAALVDGRAEVGGRQVGLDVVRGAHGDDAALDEDGGQVGDAEHGAGELLHDDDGHAGGGDGGDLRVELLDDERRQPHRELVEHEQRRLGGQTTGEGEHLLLTAGQRAGHLACDARRAAGSARRSPLRCRRGAGRSGWPSAGARAR